MSTEMQEWHVYENTKFSRLGEGGREKKNPKEEHRILEGPVTTWRRDEGDEVAEGEAILWLFYESSDKETESAVRRIDHRHEILPEELIWQGVCTVLFIL